MRVLSEVPCKLIGLADADESKKGLAKNYNIRFETDYRKLLNHVDAMIIATPASTHFTISQRCLLAGKHVLVEKPLDLKSSHARKLVDLANLKKLILAVGHLYRFNPAVVLLKDELNETGQLQYIRLKNTNMNTAPPQDCNIIYDLGSHLFDLLFFLTSKTPKKISCCKSYRVPSDRSDFADILVDYGDFSAVLEMSWFQPQKKREAWFIASDNSILIDFQEQILIKYNGKHTNGVDEANPPFINKIKFQEPLKEEILHFIECIETGKKPVNNGEDACVVIRLCELATRSHITGREIKL